VLRELYWRIRATFRGRRLDDEFDEEVREHLEMLTERFIRQGMEPAEASYAARRQFGGVTQVKQDLRERRALPLIDVLRRDIRQAFRQLRKSRRFTASAALTLALGIGVTTAVFAVLDTVMLRPLPFAEPDRLMAFRTADSRGVPHQLSYPDFVDFREQNRVFDHLVSYRDAPFTLTDFEPAVPVVGEIVSWDVFPLLGVQPERGRGFSPEEEQRGTHVAVLSHALWTNRFRGDDRILGRAISIDGVPFTVAGVAPEGFQFPVEIPAVQLWVTLSEDAASAPQRGARMLDVIGRLKPGVSADQAQAQMDVLAGSLTRQYPDTNSRIARTWLEPELERLTGSGGSAMWGLLAAVGLVLLIACANVASLLLARSTERAREFVLRIALGASKLALIRQLLIESLALGLLGAAGGVLLAGGILKAVLPLAGDRIPRLAETSVDGRVLMFSAIVAVLTSVLFGLAPALQAAAADPAGGLKEGARTIAPGHDRFRSAMVVGQIALGLVLLVAADLLIVGFLNTIRRDPGFRVDHLLTFDIGVSAAEYTTAEQMAFCDRLLERLPAIPGVEEAATGTPLPLQGHEMRVAFDIEERRTEASDRPRSDVAIVTPGYFTTMGIPLLKGRDFSNRDDAGAPPVLVVNQAFARKYFPGQDAIGKRIRPGAGPSPVMREIVGVVGDAKQVVFGTDFDPIYYFPYKQLPWRIGTIVLRTSVPPSNVESAVQAALASLDRQVPIRQLRTGEGLSAAMIAPVRFLTVLMGTLAAIALLLAVAGLYGVLSYMVARRRREIGVRIALGAGRADVMRIVSRRAALLVGPGLLLGSAGALVVARLLGNVVLGVPTGIPEILAAACFVMVITSAVAASVPAARAASVDPIQALRSE
jgi:putative ABC transport system permease protein